MIIHKKVFLYLFLFYCQCLLSLEIELNDQGIYQPQNILHFDKVNIIGFGSFAEDIYNILSKKIEAHYYNLSDSDIDFVKLQRNNLTLFIIFIDVKEQIVRLLLQKELIYLYIIRILNVINDIIKYNSKIVLLIPQKYVKSKPDTLLNLQNSEALIQSLNLFIKNYLEVMMMGNNFTNHLILTYSDLYGLTNKDIEELDIVLDRVKNKQSYFLKKKSYAPLSIQTFAEIIFNLSSTFHNCGFIKIKNDSKINVETLKIFLTSNMYLDEINTKKHSCIVYTTHDDGCYGQNTNNYVAKVRSNAK